MINNVGLEKKSKITFEDISIEFMEDKKKKVKIQSLIKDINLNKYILNYLGKIAINDLNVSTYKQFKNELDNKNLSTVYKNKIHNQVISLIKYANKIYGINNQVPQICDKFYNPNEIKKEMKFFTLDEFKVFLSVIDDEKWKLFFEILFYCGLRQGELQAITWNDINFKKSTISITKTLTTKIKGEKWTISAPKTKNSIRELPINQNISNKLKALKEKQKMMVEFNDNWFAMGNFEPIKENNIQNHKNKYCDLAGIKRIRIHDFRHSCASFLLNNRADIITVSKYLGHASISFTLDTYTHFIKINLTKFPI